MRLGYTWNQIGHQEVIAEAGGGARAGSCESRSLPSLAGASGPWPVRFKPLLCRVLLVWPWTSVVHSSPLRLISLLNETGIISIRFFWSYMRIKWDEAHEAWTLIITIIFPSVEVFHLGKPLSLYLVNEDICNKTLCFHRAAMPARGGNRCESGLSRLNKLASIEHFSPRCIQGARYEYRSGGPRTFIIIWN